MRSSVSCETSRWRIRWGSTARRSWPISCTPNASSNRMSTSVRNSRAAMPSSANGASGGIEHVSVIVPLLNEAEHVEHLVDDIASQDFAGRIEVLVADGGSRDGSVERLTDAAARLGLDLTVLPNPDRLVAQALNACIARARGELIVRLDGHSHYPPDYIRLCAAVAHETGAWNVGGIVVPEGRTPTERAVACAMDSPFGGIGWTRHAGSNGLVEVDTVTYGAFRPEAFELAGLFDESLLRNQDDEF